MATRYRFGVIILHATSSLIWSSHFLFWWDQPIDNFCFLLFWPLLVAMVATTYSCGVILLHVNSSFIWSFHFYFWWDDPNNNFFFWPFWPLLVARWPPDIDLMIFFTCKLILDMIQPFFVLVRSTHWQLLFFTILATTSGHSGHYI